MGLEGASEGASDTVSSLVRLDVRLCGTSPGGCEGVRCEDV